MKQISRAVVGGALALSLIGGAAMAAPEACKTVRFSDVGWTDITATTAATSVVLKALGYEPDVKVLSVPVTYVSLKNKDIDVFLGNWMPTMEGDIAPYREDGSVETVRENLEGAKYTLAVPKYTACRMSSRGTSMFNARRTRGSSNGSISMFISIRWM